MTEGSSEINTSPAHTRSVRSRYSEVRQTVKSAIKKSLEEGSPKSEIRSLRKGAFHAAEQMQHMLAEDPLTELLRKDYFKKRLEAAVKTHDRNPDTTLGLAVSDIDDYGKFNKTYGELTGDRVLKQAGQLTNSTLRDSDLKGRWGGEEIVIAFPGQESDKEEPYTEAVKRWGEKIAQMSIPVNGGDKTEHITMSIGITTHLPGENLETFYERASLGTRLAKVMGKNRVVEVKPTDEDGKTQVIDHSNGKIYTYTTERVETTNSNLDKEIEVVEYLTDEGDVTRYKIEKDSRGRYLRLHEALDVKLDTDYE